MRLIDQIRSRLAAFRRRKPRCLVRRVARLGGFPGWPRRMVRGPRYQNGHVPVGKTWIKKDGKVVRVVQGGFYRLGSLGDALWNDQEAFQRGVKRALRFARSPRAAVEHTMPAHIQRVANEMKAQGLLEAAAE